MFKFVCNIDVQNNEKIPTIIKIELPILGIVLKLGIRAELFLTQQRCLCRLNYFINRSVDVGGESCSLITFHYRNHFHLFVFNKINYFLLVHWLVLIEANTFAKWSSDRYTYLQYRCLQTPRRTLGRTNTNTRDYNLISS